MQSGRFQVYVPNEHARVLHFVRDNSDAGGAEQDPSALLWNYPEALPPLPKLSQPAPHGGATRSLANPVAASRDRPTLEQTVPAIVDVTMMQSSYGGNLEIVARARPPNGAAPDFLVTYWYEMSTGTWNGPFELLVHGARVTNVTGAPCLIQGTYGDPGNFELLVPQGPVISHYSRTNSDPALPWNKVRELPSWTSAGEAAEVLTPASPPPSGQLRPYRVLAVPESLAAHSAVYVHLDTSPRVQILGLATSQTAALFTSGSFGAQLVTVAVQLPAAGSTPGSETMVIYATAGETGWYAPVEILVDGAPISFISGRHAMVQTQATAPTAQVDMLVPQNGRLYHYRCDDVPQWGAWRRMPSPASLSAAFNVPAAPAGSGNDRTRRLLTPDNATRYGATLLPTYTGVSFIEIDDGNSSFFAIATVRVSEGDTASRLVMAVFNPAKGGWGKPVDLLAGGVPVMTSAG